MISKKEVQHIAKLARLGLTDKEIEKMRKELSSILDYIDQLKKIDISGVEPTSHSVFLENVMREDQDISQSFKVKRKLFELVPEKSEGYLKVKRIL